MITYHQLRTFLVVIRTGSLTKAAREINASQPTVSLQLRALQQYLGTPLFDRDRSGLRLTAGGEKLRQYAEGVLGGLRILQQDLAALDRDIAGPLAVGVTFLVNRYVLPSALFRFREQFPNVDVQLHVELPEPLFLGLNANSLDVICYINVRTPAGLTVEAVGTEELVIVVSPEHRLAGRRRVTPKELGNEPFVTPVSNPLREMLQTKLRDIGVTLRSGASGSHLDAVKKLVERNEGYSMFIRSAVAEDAAAGRLVMLKLDGPPALCEVVVAYRTRNNPSPLVQEFIRFVRAELTRDRGAQPGRAAGRLRQRL